MDGTHDLYPPDPSNQSDEFLTFDMLDDLMDLPEGEREREVSSADVRRIGPLVEYAYHDYANAPRFLKALAHSPLVIALAEALRIHGASAGRLNTSLSPLEAEVISAPRSEEDTKRPDWLAFRKRFENAATNTGLGPEFSKALSSTMREMAENVLLHSDAPRTAIVGYQTFPDEFEYVVADAGVGVYRSLKQHTDYADLKDSTEALRLATQTGETRFGRGSGHGMGFNQLVEYIAKRDSSLRFRSGDASLNVEGRIDHVTNTTRQGTFFKGFLISVVTRSSHTR
jgi:hypothetical protein